MHHHHALALLLFSIVFAGFALFTLCTFAPKSHHNNNNALAEAEDASLSSLAGLPIRRSLYQDRFENSLFVRDGILLNTRSWGGTMPIGAEPDLVKRRTDVSHLLREREEPVEEDGAETSATVEEDTMDECKPKEQQRFRFSDPSIRYWVPSEQPLQALQEGKNLMDRILTVMSFWRRSTPPLLSNACGTYTQPAPPFTNSETYSVGEYVEETTPTSEMEGDAMLPFIGQNQIGPRTVAADKEPSLSVLKRSLVGEGATLHGRRETQAKGGGGGTVKYGNDMLSPFRRSVEEKSGDADLLAKRGEQDGSALATPPGKKMVAIDFEKAERDARKANLAPGFIIETEYPTQQRKTVQHLSQTPGSRTVKLHFEGDKLVLNDPQSANNSPSTDAQAIMDHVLAKHDEEQSYSPLGSLLSHTGGAGLGPHSPSPYSTTRPPLASTMGTPSHLIPPSSYPGRFPRHDLVKRGTEDAAPERRSFRFDRNV